MVGGELLAPDRVIGFTQEHIFFSLGVNPKMYTIGVGQLESVGAYNFALLLVHNVMVSLLLGFCLSSLSPRSLRLCGQF